MTRLLFLAACFAGALATYDYGGAGGADKMAGNDMSGKASGEYMNKGADQKNAMEMNSGDKSAEYMKNGDMAQNNAMEMKPASGGAAADSSITILTSCKGGGAPVEQMAQPTMDKGMMHKVTVGGDAGLVFSPATLMAKPGDMVEFTFMSKNHTLTQSTFPEPCKKMKDGADSGFLPNADNTVSPPPTYMVQVKDTKPLWFYCKQKQPTSHCGKGMVFSINPAADKTHEAFTAAAIQQNGTAAAPADMSSSMPPPAETTSIPPPADTTAMPAAAMPYTSSSPPAPASSSPSPAPAAEIPAANPAPAPATPPQEPANLSAPAPAAAGGNNMMAGSGTMENGQCSCSCLCGVGSFPAGAGVGMYGGWSGSVGM